MFNKHEIYMQRAIDLALTAKGKTSPNPIVGAVLVYKDNIISEGFHAYAGGPHAEVSCLKDFEISKIQNREQLYLYVTLEPCAHFGKTPPCCDLIIDKGIDNIVIGHQDPNPKVAGGSIKKLKELGKNVLVGVLEAECRSINKPFLVNQEKNRPYILLKWAQSKDGFIARKNFDSKWISNSISRTLVHKLRANLDGILVGKNTTLYDNPRLNVRDWKGNSPVRIIIDPKCKLTKDLKVFDQSINTIVFNEKIEKVSGLIEYISIDFNENWIKSMLTNLYSRDIYSLMIEGGANILNQFIEAQYWDEAYIFVGDVIFKDGIKAPILASNLKGTIDLKNDRLLIYENV